ncbi:acylphosphatase [Lactobacillus xylocopicola]|uniref:acylphosphatase n=1 Tax=Lactobacillus xylocopicola TaxID=2976676 RepID=A0ABM8BHJ2_9LACO|nr:acylphosphatase [Lactobacillus xylocopicola]BDR60728.1 acylphosphatase [Lactobacillus xylocopicola]
MSFFKPSRPAQKSNGIPVESWQLTVAGIVQGVGFRWSVLTLAKQLGLAGNVRNNADSTVTITLQTSLDRVNQFCSELPRNVSPMARISSIKKEKLTNVSKIHGFHVLY